jgi:hypothetical protein
MGVRGEVGEKVFTDVEERRGEGLQWNFAALEFGREGK